MKRIRIPRDLYVERLLARRMNGFVKVLTGIRRCGKSYLLGTLFRERLAAEGVAADHIVAVDLDDRRHVALRNPLKLDAYVRGKVRRGRSPYYVFIDEIQRSIKVPAPGVDLASVAPEDRDDAFVTFFDVLNGWRNLKNVDVYVTGSNSKTLSSDIATNFRDRGQQIRVWPLSFAEWLPVSGLVDKMEAFHRYLTWGGMPVAALTDDPDERSDYLKGLFDEVYLKDIRERHGIKDDLVLANLIDILSSDIGSLTNPHKVGDTMDSLWKIRPSDHTLKSYIEHLEDAFLFGHARRFEVKGRRYLDSPVKYYATDLGLRNADVGVVPISARDAQGRQSIRQHEIDFVVNRGRDKIYVQSALRMDDAEKERRETLPLRKTGDFFKKIVITEGYGEPQADADGIIRVGVIPFMLDETILKRL